MAEGRMPSESKSRNITIKTRVEVAKRCKCVCQKCGIEGILDEPRGQVLSFKKKYHDWDCTTFSYIPFEFDHILPLSLGGKTTESNLQLLCRRCNRKKEVVYE